MMGAPYLRGERSLVIKLVHLASHRLADVYGQVVHHQGHLRIWPLLPHSVEELVELLLVHRLLEALVVLHSVLPAGSHDDCDGSFIQLLHVNRYVSPG